MYLCWDKQVISDFSEPQLTSLYQEGYVLTRQGMGHMDQTRSVRIATDAFALTSENRRILRKHPDLKLHRDDLPYRDYHWSIGKLAKDFYDAKFGGGTVTANKVRTLMTDPAQSSFTTLLLYTLPKVPSPVGYAICYENAQLFHYSYPFYDLSLPSDTLSGLGMCMMLQAILYAQEQQKRFIYLGSAQRPTDTYKLQFTGLEWFDGQSWNTDASSLKDILLQQSTTPAAL